MISYSIYSWFLTLILVTESAWAIEDNNRRCPLTALEPHDQKKILKGWKAFQGTFTEDGVSCMNCHQNHQDMAAWATGYNAFAIPLAAGVLYGYGVLLSPAAGAVLMSLSTVIVAVNARFMKIAQ